MNFSRSFCAAALLAFLPSLALAHPGHEGHELTWEFGGVHVHLEWIIGAMLFAGLVAALYRRAKKRE